MFSSLILTQQSNRVKFKLQPRKSLPIHTASVSFTHADMYTRAHTRVHHVFLPTLWDYGREFPPCLGAGHSQCVCLQHDLCQTVWSSPYSDTRNTQQQAGLLQISQGGSVAGGLVVLHDSDAQKAPETGAVPLLGLITSPAPYRGRGRPAGRGGAPGPWPLVLCPPH